MNYSKKKCTKFIFDMIATLLFNAMVEIQVSPHSIRCGIREGLECDCHVSIADVAIKKAKELFNAD